MAKDDCDTCGGTGEICVGCRNPEDACICADGYEADDCGDCAGTGGKEEAED